LSGTPSSRRLLRRSDEDRYIDVRRAEWKLRFYIWRWFVILVPATAQALEVVLAIIEGRQPNVIVRLP
jgi:hypothetical protein